MTPDDWEVFCHNLCRLRHGDANYQRVPDHDRGDFGIEGFALDGTGAVYQFYVAEAVDTAARFESQRAKINRDLGKLQKNDQRLIAMVGFPIKRWILLVPSFDSKRIVEYAAAKTYEVKTLGLACVDPADFRVIVQDEADFARERAALLNAGVATAVVPTPVVSVGEVEDWSVANAEEVETLDEKLKRLVGHHTGGAKEEARLRSEMLTYHLIGQNYEQLLETEYPELYEEFAKLKAREEDDLPVRSLTTPAGPREHFTKTREQYESRLTERVPGIGTDDARTLSWAGVAEWLIRCSLDFPGANS